MTRDRLWAPWRIGYVSCACKEKGCVLCRAHREPSKNLVIFATKHSYSILNKYPYNNGHVMVVPKRHVSDLELLNQEESNDLFACLLKTKRILKDVIRPCGFNIGMNIGEDAGAGIAGHIHIHVVPRWKGDTNFMPVVYGTKIISQSLQELKRLLIIRCKKIKENKK